jgi:hypothetical protein
MVLPLSIKRCFHVAPYFHVTPYFHVAPYFFESRKEDCDDKAREDLVHTAYTNLRLCLPACPPAPHPPQACTISSQQVGHGLVAGTTIGPLINVDAV